MLVFWIVAITAILFTIVTDIVMKSRVNSRLPASEQFSWFLRNSAQVQMRYEQLYPESSLASIRRYAFWLTCTLGAILLLTVFLK